MGGRGVEWGQRSRVGHHSTHDLLVIVKRRSLGVANVRQRCRQHTVLTNCVPRLKPNTMTLANILEWNWRTLKTSLDRFLSSLTNEDIEKQFLATNRERTEEKVYEPLFSGSSRIVEEIGQSQNLSEGSDKVKNYRSSQCISMKIKLHG